MSQEVIKAFDDIDVLEQIAEGGMSTVYKGRQRETGEIVAVKLFSPEFADQPDLVERFRQEIRVTRQLNHPHLVRGLSYGHYNGIPYLVMEFVDGPTLGDRVELEGPLDEREAALIITQIGQALHAAHQRGIIHRDVKPDNILLGPNSQAKLTDLGLMKDLEQDLGLTRPMKGLGTPNFMAPEQFDNAKNADVRCDVYGLGATFYMALTGELPFDGNTTREVWQMKINRDLPAPRSLNPLISPRVNDLILQSLSVEPEKRPATCLDFINVLTGHASASKPIPSEMPPAVERRVTVRFPTERDSFCQTIGDETCSWIGKLSDISAGGLGVVLNRRFEPGTVLLLDVQVRNGRDYKTLLARVVRTQPFSDGLWTIGCVFARTLTDSEVRELL
ncbi:MAG: hypothetical protein KatS3mg105_2469 [Gemmatales bacterium]|nr:MAG: hypothetical protein KatS3mg105_2469 [Gemmatales bacterium]